MRRWSLVVAGLYALALVAVTWPVVTASFVGELSFGESFQIFGEPVYWIVLVALAVCQLALLATPVRAKGRPLTKRTIWLPASVSALMIAGLIAGGVGSIVELFSQDSAFEFSPLILIVALISWIAWGIVFSRWGQGRTADNFLFRKSSLLFKGSVLELLIAIPTHIVARSRDYCCAGLMTFIGITMGVAVMLFSFGPSVYFLYRDRWRRLHPSQNSTP